MIVRWPAYVIAKLVLFLLILIMIANQLNNKASNIFALYYSGIIRSYHRNHQRKSVNGDVIKGGAVWWADFWRSSSDYCSS